MVDAIIWLIFGLGAAIALAFGLRYLQGSDMSVQEPIIELEPLVNCTACGSLIPEGVKRCAFCGTKQTTSNVDNLEDGSTNN